MMELFFFLLLTAGLLILYAPEIQDIRRLFIFSLKKWVAGFYSGEIQEHLKGERYREQFMEHIRLLLQTGLSLGTCKSVRMFLFLSGLLGVAAFFMTVGRIAVCLTVISSGAGVLMPYLFLRCIVQGKQVAGSQEGEILVTELLNNYKIHHCNMVHAVEQTAIMMEDAPFSRTLLFNLSRGLNRVSDEEEMKRLLHEFQFSLGTSWAGILAMNLYLACYSGMQVTDSLSDLARSMERARQLEEFLHRENNEVRMILKYLIPGSFLLLTVSGVHFFGLSPSEWFYNQFRTDAGIAWLSVTLLLYLTASGTYLLFSIRKFDL